jgi:hypothetical protein
MSSRGPVSCIAGIFECCLCERIGSMKKRVLDFSKYQ